MMKRPPKVMTPVAPRSTSLTRAIRLEAAAIRSRTPMLAVAMGRLLGWARGGRGGAAAPPRPAGGYSSFASSSVTIVGGQGQIAVLHDDLLAFLAEDELAGTP